LIELTALEDLIRFKRLYPFLNVFTRLWSIWISLTFTTFSAITSSLARNCRVLLQYAFASFIFVVTMAMVALELK